MAQYDVDLRDYWRIIKKRKTIIVLMIFLVGIASYGFAKFKEPPPLYQAGSAIKIENTANLAALLMGGFYYPTENMVTHAYILTSFPVLVQSAKVMTWIPEELTEAEIRNNEKYVGILERLKEMITAEQETGTNIINIQVVSRDPREASLVANTIAEMYREYNLGEKNRKTTETKKFIEDQLELTSRNLKRAERELQNFQEGFALISMDEQTRNVMERIFSYETAYEKIRIQRREVVNQLTSLAKKGSDNIQKSLEPLISVPSDSPIFALKASLSEMLLKRQTLLIHLTEKHPQVVEIDDQIEAVIGEIRNELQARNKALKAQELTFSRNMRKLRKENQSLPEKALQLWCD